MTTNLSSRVRENHAVKFQHVDELETIKSTGNALLGPDAHVFAVACSEPKLVTGLEADTINDPKNQGFSNHFGGFLLFERPILILYKRSLVKFISSLRNCGTFIIPGNRRTPRCKKRHYSYSSRLPVPSCNTGEDRVLVRLRRSPTVGFRVSVRGAVPARTG